MTAKKLGRHVLPQIPGDKLPEFIAFMEKNGISCTTCQKPAKELQASQRDGDKDKVASLMTQPEKLKAPIIISKNGWIMDGHHRWAAAMALDPSMAINCVQFDCTINELIALGHKFEPSFTKTVHEATTYSRKLWELMKRHGEVPDNTDYPGEEETRLMVRKTLRPY